MIKKFNIWLFVTAVVVLPITVYAVVNWYERTVQALPILVGKNHTIASFSMVNQQAGTTTIHDWKGKIVVADFFFTHCPVICPKMTASLKKVQKAYAQKDDLLITSFSVDPERDSVAQLKKYANRFALDEKNWLLLTGDKIEIYRLARKSFQVVATDGDGGPNDFIHSDQLVLIDKHQRIRGYYKGTEEKEVQQLITDIKKLSNEK